MIKSFTLNAVSAVPTTANGPIITNSLNTRRALLLVRNTKCLLLLVVSAVLVAQSNSLDPLLVMPKMNVPPVIVLVPSGGKVSAVLLATRDLPTGTSVLPVVTNGKERSILAGFTVSAPGVYPLAMAPVGSAVMAYITPPTGAMYKIRSAAMLRGYQYDGDTLVIYGSFMGGQTLVYIGTSLVPVKPTLKQGSIELSLKPSAAIVTLTVYQAGGLCDSVLVRLARVME